MAGYDFEPESENKYAILDRMVRQGDVMLYPIPESFVPDYVKKEHAPEDFTRILAFGEKSGHKHRLVGKQVQVFDTREPEKMKTLSGKNVLVDKFVKVLGDVFLVHENKEGQKAEHDQKKVKPGWYMQIQEHEFDVFKKALQRVED